MPGVDPDLPADFSNRLSASVSNWKRKLLDLSRRNRALNFKPTRVSTVAIVDEQPAEVFRHLYLDDAMMRFKAGEDKSESLKIAGNSERVSIDIEMDAEPSDFVSESEESLDFVPYDPSTVDDRHRDQWLQTKLTPEALDHSLRRIDEQARTAIEEQGVNTLFMTLGMLQHKESRDSDTWFRAPLVFLPVQLTRKSARSGYTVAAADEDALVNPALIEWLCSNFGIVLPELPDSETISDTYDLQTFLKGAAQAVANQIGWAVQGDVYLGLFSFQKLVMFKDLEANGDAIGRHRLIRQLLARAGSSVHGLPDDIRQLQLDSDFTPESTYQVVDADSSQMRAAAAVSKGHDIVIEGPPGTGKSQTITNLVAQALAAGKSVLFVAEKMAALEVVHRRLVQAGIGEFCLELHSSKANKRAVMKGLSAALDASLQPIAGTTGTGHRLPVVRGALSDYVRAVHEPFGALGKSPYGVVGELGTVLQAPKIKLDADISKVTAEDLAASVFVGALKGIDSYRYQGRPLLAWLYRIARNVVASYQRETLTQQEGSGLTRRLISHLMRRPQPGEHHTGGQAEIATSSGEGDPATMIDRLDLRDAIVRLPANQREVVILRFIVGLNAQEVAAVMDKGTAAVYSLQARAILALREHLK